MWWQSIAICDRDVATDYSAQSASFRCAVRAALKPGAYIPVRPRDACVAPLSGRPKGRLATMTSPMKDASFEIRKGEVGSLFDEI
jgi:hypothetical protein